MSSDYAEGEERARASSRDPEDAPFSQRQQDLLKAATSRLQARAATAADVVRTLQIFRDDEISQDGAKAAVIVSQYDRLIAEALAIRYEALDGAIRDTSLPFVEIDGEGLIAYANSAFLAIAPDHLGKSFAKLFGSRARDVDTVLKSGGGASLRLETHSAANPSLPLSQFRVEIGALEDVTRRPGAFAVMLDLRAEELRYDHSPDGIVRINSDRAVAFINKKAEELLGIRRTQLVGQPATKIFGIKSVAMQSDDAFDQWLEESAGKKVDTELFRPNGRGSFPVRLSILPSYHASDARAGTVLTFVQTLHERVAKEIHELLREKIGPDELARGVLQAIRKVVPFDLATFGVYTDKMRHFRVLVSEPSQQWTTRWFPVDKDVVTWLRTNQSWTDNLEEFLKNKAPSALDDPVVKAIRKDGYQNLLTVPIRSGKGKFRSALSLLSFERPYNGDDFETINSLGIREALIASESLYYRMRDREIRELKRNLVATSDGRTIAAHLVKGLAAIFDWQYVGVFRVNRSQEKFSLVDQYDATQGSVLSIEPEYHQPIGQGLLSSVLEIGDILIVPNANAKKPVHRYKNISKASASAVGVPVKVGGRIEWILDIESTELNAFQGPDLKALKELVAECEEALEQRWQDSLRLALLDAADHALLVVDEVGTIRQANLRAEELFETRLIDIEDVKVSSLGFEAVDEEILQTFAPSSQKHIHLKALNGARIPVLVTARLLNDDYGHRVILLTDLRQSKWRSDWRYLQETVTEVARQSRMPLLMVKSLLHRLKQHLPETEQEISVNQILKYIAKADITYERLATTLFAHESSEEPERRFDLITVLRGVMQSLTDADFAKVDDTIKPEKFDIQGWPDRMAFAFKSIVYYLLSIISPKGRLQIRGDDQGGSIQIQFLLSDTVVASFAATVDDEDPLFMSRYVARSAANLGLETISSIFAAHNGTMSFDFRDDGPCFNIWIPSERNQVGVQ